MVHNLLIIECWKEKVFPLLVNSIKDEASIKLYMIVRLTIHHLRHHLHHHPHHRASAISCITRQPLPISFRFYCTMKVSSGLVLIVLWNWLTIAIARSPLCYLGTPSPSPTPSLPSPPLSLTPKYPANTITNTIAITITIAVTIEGSAAVIEAVNKPRWKRLQPNPYKDRTIPSSFLSAQSPSPSSGS